MFTLDKQLFAEVTVSTRVKEMIGLVSSLVLKCDDCVKYHLQKCFEHDISRKELFEVRAISNVVCGTIVIPYLRKTVEFLDNLENKKMDGIK